MRREVGGNAGKWLWLALSTPFLPMTRWISDRLPTKNDADFDEDVVIKCRPEHLQTKSPTETCVHYSYVALGVTWRRTIFWQPCVLPGRHGEMINSVLPTAAEGDEDGEVISEQAAKRLNLVKYVHWSEILSGDAWMPRPQFDKRPRKIDQSENSLGFGVTPERFDDAAVVDDDVVDADSISKIPAPILAGDAPFYVLVLSDNEGNGAGDGGVPESCIPRHSSLQAVMQQQLAIGKKYGDTYIAECRIIPASKRAANG